MELLQNWALGVCLACLAAGVLQQFFASRSGVIKLVLTLYILVTALGTAGLAEDGLDGITDAFEARPGQSQPAVDVQSLTLAQAQAALEQTAFFKAWPRAVLQHKMSPCSLPHPGQVR